MPDGSDSFSKAGIAPPQPINFPAFDEVIGGQNPDLYEWLESRRKYNQRAGGLHRVHNGLYDLSGFVHPGGQDWLELTRGQDITESFEAHHPNIKAVRKVLEKYYVRDADWPRESPLTFEEDGFYSVLRERVAQVVKEKGSQPKHLSQFVGDTTALLFLGLLGTAAYKRSIGLAALGGIVGGWLNVQGHNFCHQKDTIRRFYTDLSGGSTETLRIHHCLSHHIYPNSSLDVEPPMFQQLLKMAWWIDEPRSTNGPVVDFFKYHLKVLPMGVLGALLSPLGWLKRAPKKESFLPYLVLLGMVFARRRSLLPNSKSIRGVFETLGLWLIARALSPWWALSSGLLVGHYGDTTWRQGEAHPDVKSLNDFGAFQLETCGDRIELYAPTTDLGLPLLVSTFGEHTLHHLFPSLDHAYHRHLYPVLAQTCNEFKIRFEFTSTWDMVKGFLRQLSRTDPLKGSRRVGWDGTMSEGMIDEARGFKVDPRK